MDDYIILIDSKGDNIIKIIDLRTGELIKSFGTTGQGPSEFISPSQIIQDPNEKNAFWIFDVSNRAMKKFNLDKILKNNFYPEAITHIRFEKSGSPARLLITPTNEIAATGFFFKNRISIYDLDGNYVRGFGKIPRKLKNYRFAPQHSHGFDGFISYSPNTGEYFVSPRLGTVIERYDKNGTLICTYIGPESFFPEYDIVPAGEYYTMTYNKKTRFGYINLEYNQKTNKLFLLYSGKYHFKQHDIPPEYGNIIYIFDINQETIDERLELDVSIHRMSISRDGFEIFGLTEKEIIRFKYKED
ncbi:MAG: BF3164 family lipoprotein [Candidatus Saccharicenans sp.]|nr:BF3164 family lipoprotein [Candidatus Saccharicenans sp.]